MRDTEPYLPHLTRAECPRGGRSRISTPTPLGQLPRYGARGASPRAPLRHPLPRAQVPERAPRTPHPNPLGQLVRVVWGSRILPPRPTAARPTTRARALIERPTIPSEDAAVARPRAGAGRRCDWILRASVHVGRAGSSSAVPDASLRSQTSVRSQRTPYFPRSHLAPLLPQQHHVEGSTPHRSEDHGLWSHPLPRAPSACGRYEPPPGVHGYHPHPRDVRIADHDLSTA